jgi:hypothetical protein
MRAASHWAVLLGRGLLLAAVAGVSILNGTIYSPLFDPVAHLLFLFTRGSSLLGPQLLFYLTTASIAVMTLLIAGVPAAIYERIRGSRQSTAVSLAIWLVAAVLLALPTLMRVLGED